MTNKIVVIGGPTGTGKTEMALRVAKQFNGELINADSRQVYKFLNIGTNKGKIENRYNKYFIDNIPIHLINLINPDEVYNQFQYRIEAIKKIYEILEKKKLPIIVGGTGLYIDSILKSYNELKEENIDLEFKKKLDSLTTLELKDLILRNNKDFGDLNESDRNNPRRLIRFILRGYKSFDNLKVNNEFNSLFLYPDFNKDEVFFNLEKRIETMFSLGLLDEVNKIIKMGFEKESPGLKIMGYREVVEYIEKKISLDDCKKRILSAHKKYLKKQITWFRGENRNYNLKIYKSISEGLNFVNEFLK